MGRNDVDGTRVHRRRKRAYAVITTSYDGKYLEVRYFKNEEIANRCSDNESERAVWSGEGGYSPAIILETFLPDDRKYSDEQFLQEQDGTW